MKEAKELNLCEILKNCPKGIILYSTDYGYLEFCFVDDTEDFPIILKTQNNNDVAYLSDGRKAKYNGAECCLFPSEEHRDWSTWESPKTKVERFDPKTFKPFDKVLVRDYDEDIWRIDMFSDIYHGARKDSMRCIGRNWYQCVPFYNDTKHLIGTTDDAPKYYRYWED